jgi:hypothetical protein
MTPGYAESGALRALRCAAMKRRLPQRGRRSTVRAVLRRTSVTTAEP